MKLEESHRQAITRYVPSFRQYLQGPDGQRDQQERGQRVELYRQLLSSDNLHTISEPELVQVIGSLWASAMWGNKAYLVGKIIQDNSASLEPKAPYGLPAAAAADRTGKRSLDLALSRTGSILDRVIQAVSLG